MLTPEQLAEFKQLSAELEPTRRKLLELEKRMVEVSTLYGDICRRVKRICDEHRPEFHKFFSELEKPPASKASITLPAKVESEEL